jgi:prepilin-type N-terminal cleavage/methylation domain-containing protein
MRKEKRVRLGFTLIELLVVIAIVGVLVALILPAVQASREAANRAKCQNNLQQLAVAAQLYHDAFGSYTSGWFCDPPAYDEHNNLIGGDPNCQRRNSPYQTYMWSGMIGLLLRLDQVNLYNELNFNLYPYSLGNTTSVRRTINAFLCPSNRRPPSPNPPTIQTQAGTLVSIRFGPSDYRGNMAAGYTLPDPSLGCASGTTESTLVFGNLSERVCLIFDNGITFQNSQISMADVTDGVSNTFLFGETTDLTSGFWPYAPSSAVRTNVDRTIDQPIRFQGLNFNTYWMSKHPNMVNFARCDGGVMPITNHINKVVLNKLMTRNGGEGVSSDELK